MVQEDKDPWDARAERTAGVLWSSKLTTWILTHGQDFGKRKKGRGSGKGGGRPRDDVGGCRICSGGSEWAGVVEQKLLEGE